MRLVYPLILSIIFGSAFVHVMRFAQLRNLNMAWVGAIHYLAAFICCGFIWATQPDPPSGWPPVVFGLLSGTLFIALYFLLAAGFKMAGAGIVQCATRVSIVIPTIVAIVAFDRHIPGVMRATGIVAALACFPFLTRTRALANPVRTPWKGPVLFLLFLLQGVVSILWKWYGQYVPRNGSAALLTFVFAVAFLGTFGVALRSRVSLTFDTILHGVALGLVNVASGSTTVAAIALLKGSVFFPVSAVGVMLVTMIASAFLWKERFGRPAIIGLAMAVAAIILISMG